MNSFVLKLIHSSESGGCLWSVYDPLADTDCLKELVSLASQDGLIEQEITHPDRKGYVPYHRIDGIVEKSKSEINWAVQQLIAKTEIGDFSPLCIDYHSSITHPIELLEIPLLVKIKADETQIPPKPRVSRSFFIRLYGYLLRENTLILLGYCIKTSRKLQDCPRTSQIHKKIKKWAKQLANQPNLESLIDFKSEIIIRKN